MGSAAAGLSREEAKVLTQVRDKGTGMKKKKEKRKKRKLYFKALLFTSSVQEIYGF